MLRSQWPISCHSDWRGINVDEDPARKREGLLSVYACVVQPEVMAQQAVKRPFKPAIRMFNSYHCAQHPFMPTLPSRPPPSPADTSEALATSAMPHSLTTSRALR
jgi:hypothetical protein